jgi:hypothetical protein
LIERKEHPDDTRAKLVVLTNYEIEVAGQAIKTVEKLDIDFSPKLQPKLDEFNRNMLALLGD